MSNSDPAIHCTLEEPADLSATLESAHIEHLDMDGGRLIAIHQSAILIVAATNGTVIDAHEFDIELWEPPLHNSDRDADEVLHEFRDDLTNGLPTTLLND